LGLGGRGESVRSTTEPQLRVRTLSFCWAWNPKKHWAK